jgi:hypothetical protein
VTDEHYLPLSGKTGEPPVTVLDWLKCLVALAVAVPFGFCWVAMGMARMLWRRGC